MSGYPEDRNDSDRDDRERDRADDERDLRVARGAVSAPAVGLIVVAVFMLLVIVLNLLQYGSLDARFDEYVKNVDANPRLTADQKKEQVQMMNQIRDGVKVAFLPYVALIGVMALVILIGAIKLKNLSSPGFVYLSAILSMVPCTLCCVLGLPFGIWAMVVMGRPEVKAGFAARRRLASSPDTY